MYTLVPETGSTSTSPITGAASVLNSRVMFILLSWPPLQPCLVCFPMIDLQVHPLRSCLHYTGKLHVSTRSTIRCRMSSNGPDQEQVLHTHRMSRRNIWPKGFGARPNPYKSEHLFTLHLSVAQIASATNSSGTFWFFLLFFFAFVFYFGKSFTHIEYRAVVFEQEFQCTSQSSLLNSLLPSQWVPVLAPT